MTSRLPIAIACGLIAAAAAGVAAGSSIAVAGGRPSTLVRISSNEPLAAIARASDANFAFVQPEDHYDGAYFYAIAHDPFARGVAHKLIDQAGYRYSHGGYGILAWAFTPWDSAVPTVLVVLNLIGIAAAAAFVSLLASRFGYSGWWGFLIALSPGLIYATSADTSEPVGLAFVAAGLLAWTYRKRAVAIVTLSFAVLCKEPFLVIPVGILLWEWFRERHRDWRTLATFIAPIGVFAAWQLYLRFQLGKWPLLTAQGNLEFTKPFKGWVQAIHYANQYTLQGFDRMSYATIALPLIIVFAIALIAGAVRAVRMRSVFAPMFLMLFLLDVFITWHLLFFPKDLVRWASIPLAVLPGVLMSERAAAPEVDAGSPATDAPG